MTLAPDLAAPIVGWRAWRCILTPEGDLHLASLLYPQTWKPGEQATATCEGDHEAPAAPGVCVCGIYAAAAMEEAVRYAHPRLRQRIADPPTTRLVIGTVKLWGDVEQYSLGWRAQHAYPERIYVPARFACGDIDNAAIAAALLENAYRVNCDVVPRFLLDDLRAAA